MKFVVGDTGRGNLMLGSQKSYSTHKQELKPLPLGLSTPAIASVIAKDDTNKIQLQFQLQSV